MTRADVQTADISCDAVAAGLQVLRLRDPNLAGRIAEQQGRGFAGVRHLTDFEGAIAFIFRSLPLRKHASELVAILDDLE
ncbi:MAG: hypothetical protein WCB12_02325 [Bryobacteraceae bacterium]